MNEWFSYFLNTELFQGIYSVIILLLGIVIIETAICTLLALRFRVEELAAYRSRFSLYYDITVPRDLVSWESSNNNWFLWICNCVKNIQIKYLSMSSFVKPTEIHSYIDSIISNMRVLLRNTVVGLYNISRYVIMVFFVPFYIMFYFSSLLEQFARFILKPIIFFMFWILGNMKFFLTYYLKGIVLVVDSRNDNTTCDFNIVYRKPTIKIYLNDPLDYSDSVQKDNLNQFTASLKKIVPNQNRIRFKTKIICPKDVDGQSMLPLTMNYLRINYMKIDIKKEEVSL